MDNKVLIKQHIKNNLNNNLNILDLLDTNGKFLLELKESLGCNITTMNYNSLITAIPTSWKKSIKENFYKIDMEKIRTNSEPHIINTTLKSISKIKNKQIYMKLLIKFI